MRKYAILIMIAAVAVGILLANQARQSRQGQQLTNTQISPAQGSEAAGSFALSGKVIETMDAGGYTYAHVDNGSEHLWIAGPRTGIEVGDEVAFNPGMQMKDFRSETLDRTFDMIYFVSEIAAGGLSGGPPEGHPRVTSSGSVGEGMDFSGIDVPKEGKSIADLYADKSGLGGKEIIARGKVVKFTADVMGKNWIHLMDGTGTEGANDLTVTTDAVVEIGDVVLVKGVVTLNKDFGFGYAYDIIVEDAEVTVE
jgi:hypothetical protein